MAVVVRLEEFGVARVDCGVWASDDPDLTALLQGMRVEVHGSDPNPDLRLAAAAIERLGGEILEQPAPWHPEAPAVASGRPVAARHEGD